MPVGVLSFSRGCMPTAPPAAPSPAPWGAAAAAAAASPACASAPRDAASAACSASAPPRDVLSQCTDKLTTVFVGRLPRRRDVRDIQQVFGEHGAIHGIYSSGDTYCFVQYETLEAAGAAVAEFNGLPLGPPVDGGANAKIIVLPATRLTRLFIGGLSRGLAPQVIEDAVRSREEVRATPPRTH